MAKMVIVTGLLITAIGLAMLFAPRIPWLGRLPGDINLEGKNGSFHFPIVTCLILSVVLTILLNLFTRR
jgi:hypothetical protein